MKLNNTKIVPDSVFLVVLLLTMLTACGGGGNGNQASAVHWTKQLGVPASMTRTSGYAVATDASGNIYVSGETAGGLDGNTLTGDTDLFLTKYNASGTRLYTRQLGVPGSSTVGHAVATDASGNVYVAGETNGAFPGNVLTGTTDFFLAKYDATGSIVYIKQMGAAGVFYSYTRAFGVATDASGNVFVAGETNDGLDGNTLTGTFDFFLTKYDSSGTKVYTKQMGVPGSSTSGHGVATDASGNVYVSGYTNGGLDGNALTGSYDFFFTKYNASGRKLYTMQLGVASHSTYGRAVATDASGNVYVSGSTNGGLDGNTLMGNPDFFLVKYDSSANKLYSRQLGVPGLTSTFGNAVATDASGNVYVTGETNSGLDGNTLTGTVDFFLTKYTSAGVKVYTKQLGVALQATRGHGVATDASGNVYVSGETAGNVSEIFGGLEGNPWMGLNDFFLTKYGSSGN